MIGWLKVNVLVHETVNLSYAKLSDELR